MFLSVYMCMNRLTYIHAYILYLYVYIFTLYINMNIAIYVYLYSLISYTSIIIFICYKKKYIHTMKHARTEPRNICLYQRWNGIHSLTLWYSKFWKTLDFGGDIWKHQSTFAMTMTTQTLTSHHTIEYLITNSSTIVQLKVK